MTRRKAILGLCLSMPLMLLAGQAGAGTIRADVSDSQYTNLAGQTAYASVGLFQWTDSGSQYLASGTVIADQWVLTAAHVVDGIGASNIGSMTFTLGGVTFHAAETYYNSDWTGTAGSDGDIGLVRLATSASGVTPAELYTGSGENHLITTMVGYGLTGTGLTGATGSAGTKRAGTNVISLGSALNSIPWSAGGDDSQLVADFDSPQTGATGDPTTNLGVATSLEYCVAPGDSGGGWFVNVGGVNYLAGVTSYLLSNPANPVQAMYGDICAAMRVSSYLDWIWGYTVLRGDVNRDGLVNVQDINPFVALLASGGFEPEADLNGDHVVNVQDINPLVDLLGGASAGVVLTIPEPAAMSVLLLAGLACCRRRGQRGAAGARPGTGASRVVV